MRLYYPDFGQLRLRSTELSRHWVVGIAEHFSTGFKEAFLQIPVLLLFHDTTCMSLNVL